MQMIHVDFSKPVRQIKVMNAVNNGPIRARSDQTSGNFMDYKAIRIPYARNHDAAFCASYGGEHTVDISAVFPNFDADPDDPASYDFVLTDNYVRTTLEAGTETFYRLGSKIEHNIKKYGTLPPKDPHKWCVICEHIIRHYTEGWADGMKNAITYWEIWNEPDLDPDDSTNKRCWGGTKAQFFDLFAMAARHLKYCFPNLKIGGPASAGNEEWAREFLAEMSVRRIHLDFFSWHIYMDEPIKLYDKAVRMREMLDRYGYTETESICNEWNYIKNWDTKFEYSVTQIHGVKNAPFAARTMSLCQDGPVDMLMYYDARPSTFNGLFSLYNYELLPAYYVYGMWADLRELGTEVTAEGMGEGVTVTAAKDENGRGGLMIAAYCDDDSVTSPVEVEICIDGLGVTGAKCRMVDSVKRGEETELAAAQTYRFALEPNTVCYLALN